MKNKISTPLVLFMLVFTGISISFTTIKKKKPVLRHVVSFQFKEEITLERRAQAVKDFLDLKNRIPAIKKFEGGENISVEGYDKGFTHCYVLTFANEEGRSIYLPHPAHIEVAKKNKPLMKDLFVVDYWGEE
ncbi:Dabb family protein [Fulvivirgaceae bacterium BMA12]|uniref:Dabb family protein n=1 Tax=Agaribacillus aureus TaxID=3051825 RepID=A0ABT8LDM1_9BACT|nr:Dabb family protein [Fulvivirgaceae bacterium BMA12]